MKLFIATPTYGGMAHVEYFVGIMQSLREFPWIHDVSFVTHESLVPRARNILASRFLASPCDKMLFIDSDIIFQPRDVERIASHDEDLVGGFYPLKRLGNPAYCLNPLPGQEPQLREDGLAEVLYVGTGFLCLTRSVLERIAGRWPEDFFTADVNTEEISRYDWFKVGVHKGRYLSEDWFFCDRWRELGGKVYADSEVRLRHIGKVNFPINLEVRSIALPAQPVPSASEPSQEAAP